MDEGSDCIVAVSPAPAADGNREGRSTENANDEGNGVRSGIHDG
jgi:hypothetical protein